MSIVVAIILTINKIFWYIMQTALIIGIIGAIVMVVGVTAIAWSKKKHPVTQETHEEEDTYIPQPGKRLVVSSLSDRMWREIDRANDEQILQNTKEL